MAIPNAQFATGTATAAGVVASLAQSGASGYIVILDGTSVATSSITVAVQVLDISNNSYVTPTTIGNPGVTQPVTLTNATIQIVQIPGGFPGIQINITSFGTATGTFRGVVMSY